MDKDWFGYFIAGILIGTMLIGLFYLIANPIRVDASHFKGPSKIYIVTVDDLVFHCRREPNKPSSGLRLYGCQEGYGRIIVIRNFESYSVTRVETLEGQ